MKKGTKIREILYVMRRLGESQRRMIAIHMRAVVVMRTMAIMVMMMMIAHTTSLTISGSLMLLHLVYSGQTLILFECILWCCAQDQPFKTANCMMFQLLSLA